MKMEGREMSRVLVIVVAVFIATAFAVTGFAADDSKVKSATRQVEEGAKTIGDGKVGTGAEETAKGVGKTVVEGARYTGDKVKDSAKAAEPQAKDAWESLKESANSFGASVKSFVTRLFSK
jgi:hypothetical protein